MVIGKRSSICRIQLIEISLQLQAEDLTPLFEYTATSHSVHTTFTSTPQQIYVSPALSSALIVIKLTTATPVKTAHTIGIMGVVFSVRFRWPIAKHVL